MVVNSPGTASSRTWPILNTWAAVEKKIFLTCVSMWIGCQANGKTYSPVSRRIGFGAWHSTCSGEGSWSRPDMKSQNGFPVITPWVKSNSPGPSVVPAAKLYPRAGGQVCEVDPFARVTGAYRWKSEHTLKLSWQYLRHVDPLVDELHGSFHFSFRYWLQQQFSGHSAI